MPPSLQDPQNLVFLAPFAAGVFLAFAAMAAGAAHGGHGAHAHAGHAHPGGHAGHGGHASHGGVAPAHAAPGHAAHGHAANHHSHNGHGKAAPTGARPPGFHLGALLSTLLGLNQAPLTVLLWTFLIGWGFCGFFARYLFGTPLEPAVMVAGIGGFAIARTSAALVTRMMPPDTTSAVSREQLLGRTGRAVFAVTESTGRLHVYDQFGTLHEEPCRLEKGQASIEKGCEVLLIDYDDQRRLFLVERVAPIPVTTPSAPRSMH